MAPKRGEDDRVELSSLPPQQLAEIRDRVDSDFDRLAESQAAIHKLISKFNASAHSIEMLASSKEGQPLLLPLTSSLYAQGKVADSKEVLIDIGTGYYVKMTSDQAMDFCRRKVLKLKENAELVTANLQEKRRALMQINSLLQQKVAAGQQ